MSTDPTLLIIGGLALLLIIVILVRNARKKPAVPVQPTVPLAPEVTKPAPVVVPANITLEFPVENGPSVVYTLNKPLLTLGRSQDNDIVVPESVPNFDTVSLHHAQLRRDKDDYLIRDTGSRNGLLVNGRHTQHNLLADGDRLGFGAAEAIFHKPRGGSE